MSVPENNTSTGNLTIFTNPLIEADLTLLRQQEVDLAEYNRAVGRISCPLASLASRVMKTKAVDLYTKWGKTTGSVIDAKPLIIYIERGVKAMRHPFDLLYPEADTLTLTASRRADDPWQADITLNNLKLPPWDDKRCYIIVDATCATGGTIFAVADMLKKNGLINDDGSTVNNLAVVSIFCGQPGLDRLFKAFPYLHVYTSCVIPQLDENCYLIHGPYDAGNRGNFRIETINSLPGGH